MTRRDALKWASSVALAGAAPGPREAPSIPDALISEAYRQAAAKNVLASVNPGVFAGYFSVCADGQGFGYGNTYPSLDGHQLSDALLWLGQVDTVCRNFAYVKTFQREDGLLPIAILPRDAGKLIGPEGYTARVEPNGGLYRHWVPGNPLEALASPTYIQNADVLFRHTLDRAWLQDQISSVNRAAEYLARMITPAGMVRGAGYYVERPARVDCDGVSQPHAIDAFKRAAALNRVLGGAGASARFTILAQRLEQTLVRRFWAKDRFVEYIHPERGAITAHGYTDADWAALAFGCATRGQRNKVWAAIRREERFYYGGMPTGISTKPESYEPWEFTHPDRQDLAAMGRVWYLEAHARARMDDASGLVESIRRVCHAGQQADWYWRERYNASGGYGARKYCEYPANLIRIVQRFLMGVELGFDGTLTLAPVAPADFWDAGFGQTLEWGGGRLTYRFERSRLTGRNEGATPLTVVARLRGRETVKTTASGERFEVRL
ncbi:MAG: hypothetical protein IT161_16325 [Bryobacterales bacterium]|nr:hypothetical protein [Bryobacterales bacterium]